MRRLSQDFLGDRAEFTELIQGHLMKGTIEH